ncbi:MULTISPECIES: flagellar hook-associated protein FlgL [Nocardioides]|uniref:Flagellar hook-associated protein 3 FlgL n=1 Tax=Nocardioides lianchengensis TaxID=1045774 RepID=A0A1G6U3L9_9ACTN|nr:flagellar hook-associated protein FlgL [Nocardioides lianchengensis]NYG11542.1 flagellar hook-associated protein 3 FlgL [Nocardioides lianchengensis]SDD35929.1 flagellar hook-associated protein 3 FlgL [Nocardioides lianchengensis]
MTSVRVTQSMLSQRSLLGVQTGLARLAATQEHLTTGRVLNRPSDSPTDSTIAMRLREQMADQKQYARNAQDGLAWLGSIDTTLSSMTTDVRRARDLALQGANTGSMSATSREALATEIDQIRDGLIARGNASYLGRPLFGGVTSDGQAFDPDTGAYSGDAGTVSRTIATGVEIRVDVTGTDVVGPNGNSLFDHLAALSTALRSGDEAGVDTAITQLSGRLETISNVQADVGTRYLRVEGAVDAGADALLTLTSQLSEIENADLPSTIVDLQLQEVAYQAALAATSRVMQPSLVDFLR